VRPRRLVLVVGTGTEVGKTWVSAHLLHALVAAGHRVGARKPAQSYDDGDDLSGLDAAVLGDASGERAESVCPPHRWYPVAMAPPMAAEALGRPPFTIADLVGEIEWPARLDIGLVETAGGVRSPQAADGDAVALCAALGPDVVVLVADAGLGTINAVRLTLGVLPAHTIVVLNRFDAANAVHVGNRQWLEQRDGTDVVVLPDDEEFLVASLVARPA
jgi:dethiobiotin synthetase